MRCAASEAQGLPASGALHVQLWAEQRRRQSAVAGVPLAIVVVAALSA
jgi:hypothetical protein